VPCGLSGLINIKSATDFSKKTKKEKLEKVEKKDLFV
jgi:hypothetical protein